MTRNLRLFLEPNPVRHLLALLLTLTLSPVSMAQTSNVDGRWEVHVACSAHTSNGRPGFDWSARVTVQSGQFVHVRGTNDRNPYEESWNGQFSPRGNASVLRLSASGSRPNGARWDFRFAPADVLRSEVELTGGVFAREKGEETRVRTCTANLKREGAPIASETPVVPRPTNAASKPIAAVANTARSAMQQATMASIETPRNPPIDPVKAAPRTADGPAAAARVEPAGMQAPAIASAPAPTGTRSQPRTASEVRKVLYEDAGFDLALVVPLPGSGNLKRSLDGQWTVGAGGVSVGTMSILASDQHYDVKGFAALAPAERNLTVYAAQFYRASLYHPHPVPGTDTGRGFRGPTPVVSAGISPNPTLRASAQTAGEMKPEQALKAALGQAVDQALTKAIGKPLAHSLVYQSSANIVLVPRHKVDPAYSPPLTQGHWAARIQAGEAVVLAYITQEQLRQGLKSHQSATTAANQREANLLTTLQNSPAAGPDGLVGAITVRTGVNVKPCSLKSELDWAPYLLKHEPIGAWITDRAPKWSHERPQGFDSADALFDELKSGRRCTAVFGRGPMIAKLAAALDRDRVGNLVYSQPQPQRVVLGLKAQALGFDDVDMLEFAESIGTQDPQQVKALQKLGAGTKPLVDQARERLKKYDAQATTRLEVLIALLQDEADARKQGITIEKLQTARAAREEKAAKAAAVAHADEEKRIAKEFPYVAQLRCRIGTQTVNLMACLMDGGVDTEIELRNGSDYRMYKAHEAQSLGRWSDDGVAISLRPAFALKAQNASSNAVLDVVIRERLGGKVKFQKSAARFGVVAVQN